MRRNEVVAALVIYVIPVGVAAVLLALVGLGVLAAALVVIEVGVATAIYLARRQPERPAEPTPRPWLVPSLMVGSLGLMVVVAVIASHFG